MATGFVGQAFVQISPSFQGFQKEVGKEVTKQLKGAGEEAGKAAGEDTGKHYGKAFVDTMGKGAGKIANAIQDTTAIATAAFVGFAIKSAKAAMEASDLAIAIQQVGKNTKVGAPAIIKTAQSIQAQGVAFDAADKLALSFARAHLKLTDATKLTTVAQDASVLSGKSVSDTLATVSKGILTLQPRALKQVGLTVDAASAYKLEAKQLGIKASQLTVTEKRQALMNAVMQSGTSISGTYAKALDEPSVALKNLPTLFHNIEATVGQTFTPAIGKAIRPFYDFVLYIQGAIAPGGKLAPIVKAIGDALSTWITPLGRIGTSMTNWLKALSSKQIGQFAKFLHDNLGTIAKFAGAMSIFAGQNLLRGVPIIGELVGKFNPLLGVVAELVATNPQLRAEFKKLFDAVVPLLVPLGKMVNTFVKDLMPVFGNLVDEIMPVVVWVLTLTDSFFKLIEPIKPLADLIGGALVLAFLALKLQMFSNPWLWIIGGLALAFMELWKLSKPLAIAIFGIAAAMVVLGVAMGILDAIPLVAVIVAIVAAIIALVLGLIWLVKNWQLVWDAISKAATWAWNNILKPTIAAIGGAFMWLYKNVIQPVVNAVVAAWNWLANAIQWAYDNIIHPVITVMGVVLKILFAIYVAPILIAIWLAWTAMSWAINFAWVHIIQPTINAVAAIFGWLWRNILTPIFNAITVAWRALATAFKWVYDTIIHPTINSFAAAFQWFWNVIVHPIMSTFQTVWRTTGDSFKWVFDHIISLVFSAIENGIRHARDVFTGAVSVMSSAWSGIKNAIAVPARWVVDTIINPLIKGANHLLDKINLHVDPIPKFAEGGKVPGIGNQDSQLSLLTPGEWVLTKAQARGIGYSNLAGLPRYKEGGPVGGTPMPGAPSHSSWYNPVDAAKSLGHKVVGGFEDIADIGKSAVNEATGLLRFAASEAFKAFTLPLVKILEPVATSPQLFTAAMAKWGLSIIKGLTNLIAGHSDANADVGGTSGTAAGVVNEAMRQLGKPYVWGARGPNSFDCSGLVDWSYGTAPGSPKTAGWTGPRVGPTTEQQSVMGKIVDAAKAAAADLWFFGNPVHHVGIATGKGREMVHAPHTGDVVRMAQAWGNEPNFVRRLIESSPVPSSGSGPGGPVERWRPVVEQALKLWGMPVGQDIDNAVLQIIKGE